ncbi:MAG: redoxin domain-containing protein [Cytophagales bacterium]
MKLSKSRIAPDFAAIDVHGKEFKLSYHKGKKIVLSFFRNVGCPFCNRRVHQLMGMKLRPEDANTVVVCLFESSNEKLRSSVMMDFVAPWPLVGNHEKNIYKMNGVEESFTKLLVSAFVANAGQARTYINNLGIEHPKDPDSSNSLMPADFLIDEQFTIQHGHYGKHIDDHIDFNLIVKLLWECVERLWEVLIPKLCKRNR